MNARADPAASFQSTPTTATPGLLRAKRSSSGASWRQGVHQLAQKLITAGFPCREETLTGRPWRTSLGRAGAVRFAPEVVLKAPAAISATIATAAQPAPTRRPRLTSGAGEKGHVVDDLCRLEVGRVERRQLAAAGDPIDQRRVLDRVGDLRRRRGLGDDVPGRPDPLELRKGADQVLHLPRHLVLREEALDRLRSVAIRVDRDGDDLEPPRPRAELLLRGVEVADDDRADVWAVVVDEGDEHRLAPVVPDVDRL